MQRYDPACGREAVSIRKVPRRAVALLRMTTLIRSVNMPSVLIVAFGNPLCSDDGLAWHAADLLAPQLPAAEILRLQQFGPELAETVRHYDLVIFLDAAMVPGSAKACAGHIAIQEIGDQVPHARASHACAPGEIVRLARELYDAHPPAYLATMVGENFAPGETLSPAIAAALPAFVAQVAAVIASFSLVAQFENR